MVALLALLPHVVAILSALAPFVGLVVTWWKASGDAALRAQGATAEAAKIDQVSAVAEAAVAAAEADAPDTQLALVDRLKAGTA